MPTNAKHSASQPPTRPAKQAHMQQQPQTDNPKRRVSGKLKDKVATITGGDSGIGLAIAVACQLGGRYRDQLLRGA